MTHKFKNIYFAIKCFLISFTALVVSLLVIFVAIENANIEKKVNDIKASEKMFVSLIGEFIASSMKTGVYDLKYLSDTFSLDDTKNNIKWETILKSDSKYKSIRLVDETGSEVFSVDETSDNSIKDISEEKYFADALNLDIGEIYLSEVVIKEINDCNEQFSVMMISPIDNNGQKLLIILEFDASYMFDVISGKCEKSMGNVYIINNFGYWRSYDNKYREVDSNYFQLTYDIGINPPEEWQEIKDSNHIYGDIGLYTFTEMNYLSEWKDESDVGVVADDNSCKIVTLIEAEGEYRYYFVNEVTLKIAKVFEDRYMYFIGSMIISITIVLFLLANKNNLEKMKNFSHYDPLTKVYNRRQGFELLENHIENIKRHKRICLCFIDINGLKEVNDTLGHALGDELILTVTDTIKNTIRQDDMIIRMGGDEFLIVLAKVGKSIAETIWTRIVESFKSINAMDNRKYLISVSHGIVEVSYEDENIDLNTIITEADDKMYKEKMRIKKGIKIVRHNIE